MAGKPQESNPWSSLSTVTTFDNGNHSWTTRCVDETEVQGSGQIVGRVAPSTSLLIESLVQQLCTMFEGDAMRRNKLYYAICDRLYEMKLIDGSYNKMEFESMRGQYQVALYKLVAVARALTGSESTLKVPNGLMAEWSRYRREFIELEFIATGGFGSVFKAQHRLDGNVYAVKKIAVRSGRVKTIMKHLEEVKTIARLNHTNIVSYKGAWIEQSFPMTIVQRFKTCNGRRTGEKKDRPLSSLRDNGRGIGDNRAGADSTAEGGSDRTRSGSIEVCHRSDSEFERGENDDDDDYDGYIDDDDDDEDDDDDDDDNGGDDDSPLSESRNIAYKTGMYMSNNAIRENVDDDEVRDVGGGSSGGYLISHDIVNERFQQLNSATNLIGRRISESLSSRIEVEKNDDLKAEEPEDTSDIVSFRSESRDCNYYRDGNGNVSPVSPDNRTDEYNCTDNLDGSESFEGSSGDKRQLCKFDSTAPQRYAILYIQMALCDQTLRQWLDDRRESTPLHIVTAILTQILSGLEYIHSLGIVHHDIKPSNIFISKSGNMQIQLGDFGLACPLQTEGRHSVHGTPTYAAPEQLNGNCDPKSDVYSLGIVLLELLVPMQTCMERSRVIAALKKGQLPQTLTAAYPQWTQIIRQLVQDNPKKRSSPTELLKYLSEDKDSIIARLREDNVRKDDLIQELRNRIEQLKATIERHKIELDDT